MFTYERTTGVSAWQRPEQWGAFAQRPVIVTAPRRGLTLVEVLAACTILSVLLAIILPVISTIRLRGREQGCVSVLRQQVILVHQYTNDHRDSFPYGLMYGPVDPLWMRPVDLDQPFAALGYVTLVGARAWEAMAANFEKDLLYLRPRCPFDRTPAVRSPESRPSGLPPTVPDHAPSSYEFSAALYIDPNNLDPSFVSWSRQAVGARRMSEVHHPATKAVLFDGQAIHESWYWSSYPVVPVRHSRRGVAASDGSAQVRATQDCSGGVPLDTTVPVELTSIRDMFRLTPHGVRGKDW